MRVRARGFLALLFAFAALAGGAWAQGQGQGQGAWHRMTGPDRGFTAELPTAPKYTATKMKTGSGAAYTMHQYVAEVDDVGYVVQTATYPGDADVSKPRAVLEAGLDNAARNMDGGAWASIDWPEQRPGLTAYDAVGARKGLAVRSYSVIRGRQVVTLTYAGPSGSARSADADRFIGSLRVEP
jgi:hypothetical protein